MSSRQTLDDYDTGCYDSDLYDHDQYFEDASFRLETYPSAPYCEYCNISLLDTSDFDEYNVEPCSSSDEFEYDYDYGQTWQYELPLGLNEVTLKDVAPLPNLNQGRRSSSSEVASIPRSTRPHTPGPRGSSLPSRVVKRKLDKRSPDCREGTGRAPVQASSVSSAPTVNASSVRPHRPHDDVEEYYSLWKDKELAAANRISILTRERLHNMRSTDADPHHLRPGNRIVPYKEMVHEAQVPRAGEEGVRFSEVKEMLGVNGDLSTGRVFPPSARRG